MFGFGRRNGGGRGRGMGRGLGRRGRGGRGMHGRGRRWLGVAGLHEWPLTYALGGETVKIVRLPADAGAAGKLRDMGLYEDAMVRIEASADPVVLDVLGSRIAISRRLAEQIMVRPNEGNTGMAGSGDVMKRD